MMISSQLTKFRKKSLGWSVRGFFSWAKRKVAWTGRWSKAPVLWWPGNGKKHQSFWHKFAGTHFVWLVGDSYARTSSWTLDLKIRYFFGLPSSFWHHRNSSHLICKGSKAPGDFGAIAWNVKILAPCESAKQQTPIAGMQKPEAWKKNPLFGQKLNKTT